MGLLTKVVSGGQTGVDRAALDAGIKSGLVVGGWCPRGRLAEDGVINKTYPLVETPSVDYAVRTEWNVRDSEGTLILYRGEIHGGTALTREFAVQYGKPFFCSELRMDSNTEQVVGWIRRKSIQTLNVAGPRESSNPGIYSQAYQFLIELFTQL
jgi:hypothetical protein